MIIIMNHVQRCIVSAYVNINELFKQLLTEEEHFEVLAFNLNLFSNNFKFKKIIIIKTQII